MNKKSIPLKNAKVLWGRSGSKCALCKTDLIQEKIEGSTYPIGEIAHIKVKSQVLHAIIPTWQMMIDEDTEI